jgi:hypothetical protein
MSSGKSVLFLLFVFFTVTCFTNISHAQVRSHDGQRHRSYYLSGGYNISKFGNSTLHIAQPSAGNKYDLLKVKADGNATVKSIFPWQLNYRFGYYFNYEQTYGVEIGYDPVKYHVTDGQNVQQKGTVNDVANVTNPVVFSAKNGYAYALSGANFLMLNLVRRFTVFRPYSNTFAIDAIAKIGAGPAMPTISSSFPTSSATDPQFKLCGWNAGAEGALRISIYRYAYVELACKYDYAMYNKLRIHDGIAKQNLNTIELIGLVGCTLPSNRFNPLFYRGHKVITIIPFYQKKGIDLGEMDLDKMSKKKRDGQALEDIPEFQGIVDKKASLHPKDTTTGIRDTTAAPADTSAAPFGGAGAEPDHKETKKERKKRLKEERLKKEQEAQNPAGANAITDSSANNGARVAPPAEEKKSKKQLKKEKEEQKKKEKAEQEKLKQEQELKDKQEQEQAQKPEAQEQQKKELEDKKKELEDKKKELEEKKAKEQQEREDKKEQEKKAREELKAQKEKEREELKAKREKEIEERKNKKEQEMKELKEKREKEKEEREAKKQKEKEEKEAKDKGN